VLFVSQNQLPCEENGKLTMGAGTFFSTAAL
jgi:hypothetical protein